MASSVWAHECQPVTVIVCARENPILVDAFQENLGNKGGGWGIYIYILGLSHRSTRSRYLYTLLGVSSSGLNIEFCRLARGSRSRGGGLAQRLSRSQNSCTVQWVSCLPIYLPVLSSKADATSWFCLSM